jgi:3'-phosphoadenosine 5'-phosphosulfate sulfotransferase (PAPS reductase)/FAD synthetase
MRRIGIEGINGTLGVRTCSNCVTPDSYPGTVLDEDGVCNHCRDFESRYRNWETTRHERLTRFEHFVQWARKQQKPYDALVPLSGGKDSTYVLYLATKKYGLRVLCYTFDNGFQTNIALENVKEAVERSGADHIIIKPSPKNS